jgi:hypothetical protein
MKTIIVGLLAVFLGNAQIRSASQISPAEMVATDPATCVPSDGRLVFNTVALVHKYCSATNTWTPIEITTAADLPTHASRHKNGGNDEVGTATPGANVIPKAGSDGTLASGFLPVALTAPIPIPGAVFKSAVVNNAASGDVDIYTAQAGRRALVGSVTCYNPAGTTTNVIPKIKISGTYYRLAANQAVTTGATAGPSINAILEPGDSAALNFSQAGCNCWATVIDYPSTVPIYSPRLTSFSTGDNTIYTVPPSRTAVSVSNSSLAVVTGTGTYATDTAHTVKWYLVNSGGSTGSTNQATASTAVSANNASFPNPFKTGSAGDFVVVNTDGATGVQFAWMTVLELP